MKERFDVKDLINIGVFGALYIILYSAVSFVGMIPVCMLIIEFLCPIIAGIPLMILITKTKHFGNITILGVLVTLFMLVMGKPLPCIGFGLLAGVSADLLLMAGGYQSKMWTRLAFGAFNMWCMGMFITLFFSFRDDYLASYSASYGDVYIEKLANLTPAWMFYVLFVATFIGGIVGAFFNEKVLKKHFVKAGIV